MAMSAEMLALIHGAKNKFSRGGGKIYKLKEGKTRFRILTTPTTSPIAVAGQFWQECGVNWIKTESNGKPVAVVGNSMIVFGVESAVDKAIEMAIRGAVTDDDIKLMKEWKAKTTILLNVVIKSGGDASENAVALEITPTTFGTIMGMVETYADDSGYILDHKTGFEFTIEKSGRGLETKYVVLPHPGAKPVSKASLDSAIDLFALVESEFFRGEEGKALTAIGNLTGVNVSGLKVGALPVRNTALLTRPSASVPDAEVEAAAAAVAEVIAAEPEVEVVETKTLTKREMMAAQLAELEAEEALEAQIAAKLAAKASAKAPAKAPAKAAAKVAVVEKVVEKAEDQFGAAMDPADLDSVLSELDAI